MKLLHDLFFFCFNAVSDVRVEFALCYDNLPWRTFMFPELSNPNSIEGVHHLKGFLAGIILGVRGKKEKKKNGKNKWNVFKKAILRIHFFFMA